MPGFSDVLTAAFDLINANIAFKNQVSKYNFSEISDTGSLSIVLVPGDFTAEDEGFGGVYAVEWEVVASIFQPISGHIENEVEDLTAARDTLVDLVQKNIYLGKGEGNAEGIEMAHVERGGRIIPVLDEDDTLTHLSFDVRLRVRQQMSVTLAE